MRRGEEPKRLQRRCAKANRRAFRTGIALALGLLSSQASAFRTAADLPAFEGARSVRWAAAKIDYERSESTTSPLGPAAQDEAWHAAFSAWAGVACTNVTFNNTSSTNAAAAPGDG